jgi:flagellar hook-length control protein FliK
MIVTLPSSAQAQRPSAATAAEPNAAVAAASPVLARTLETVGRGPHSALDFIGELQRIGAALALPLPLLSRKPLAGHALPTSEDAKASDSADGANRSEALLSAMQLPAMQLPTPQPFVAALPVSLAPGEIAAAPSAGLVRGDSMVKTSDATLSGQLASGMVGQMVSTQPLVTASPVLQAVALPTHALPTAGLTAGLNGVDLASSKPVATSASVSTQHARAAVSNTDALAAIGALSPEAAAVRERSTGHSASMQTADLLAQAVSMPNSDVSATQTVSAHASGTATRTPQALVDALGERIEWQLKTGSERAVIRLDPPMQGQLEITIRRDAGVVQVQLSATHGDVVKQLQAISDTLRQDLAGRQTGEVVVVVSQYNPGGRDGDGRGRQPGQNPEQAEPGRALAEAESGQTPARFALSKSL